MIAIALAQHGVGLAIALSIFSDQQHPIPCAATPADYAASLVQVVAVNSSAALAFRDPDTANEILACLW